MKHTREKPYTGRDRIIDTICYAGLVAVMFLLSAAIGSINPLQWEITPTTLPTQTLPPIVIMSAPETTTDKPPVMYEPPVASYALLAAAAEVAPTPTPEPVMTSLGKYYIVGYNYTDAAQCGKEVANGITASGEPAVHGKTAAMEGIPFGTEVYIEGYGTVTINDRGASGNMVDVAFADDESCYAITGYYDVYIMEG